MTFALRLSARSARLRWFRASEPLGPAGLNSSCTEGTSARRIRWGELPHRAARQALLFWGWPAATRRCPGAHSGTTAPKIVPLAKVMERATGGRGRAPKKF